jgi:hypothetical protein
VVQKRKALAMAKAKIPSTAKSVLKVSRTAPTPESSLLVMRLKELDREFARQTKQLTALTKKLGKKIAGMPTDKSPKN